MMDFKLSIAAATAAITGLALHALYRYKLDALAEAGNALQAKRARKITYEKGLVLLGWDTTGASLEEIKAKLAPFCKLNDLQLEVYLKDDDKDAPSPTALNIFPLAPPVTLHIALFHRESTSPKQQKRCVDNASLMQLGLEAKQALGFPFALKVFVVSRSVYTEYGEYDGPADCPKLPWSLQDNGKSPYIIAHTCFPKPYNAHFVKLTPEQWANEYWFAKQSGMSEMIQPRARYVRNVVLGREPDAPNFAGIVIEAWPSKRHMENPFVFFHARNVFELILHMMVMGGNVTRFTNLLEVQGSIMQEWLEKQPKFIN